MTIEQWLEDARMDAFRRQLPELADLLEGLAKSTAVLRAADWNDDASGRRSTTLRASPSSTVRASLHDAEGQAR